MLTVQWKTQPSHRQEDFPYALGASTVVILDPWLYHTQATRCQWSNPRLLTCSANWLKFPGLCVGVLASQRRLGFNEARNQVATFPFQVPQSFAVFLPCLTHSCAGRWSIIFVRKCQKIFVRSRSRGHQQSQKRFFPSPAWWTNEFTLLGALWGLFTRTRVTQRYLYPPLRFAPGPLQLGPRGRGD